MHLLTGPLNGNLMCLNNLVLPNGTEVKDLGIIVDHELKFKRSGYYHQSTPTSFTHTEMF